MIKFNIFVDFLEIILMFFMTYFHFVKILKRKLETKLLLFLIKKYIRGNKIVEHNNSIGTK